MRSLITWRRPARTSRQETSARRSSRLGDGDCRLQADLDAMAAETVRLRQVEQEAQTALHDAELARDAARERFRLCQRAVTKLDRLAEEERRKAQRLEAAYAEADLDERAIMAAASTAEQNWA